MAHTPEPWREGKTADSIVADSPEGLPPYSYPEVLEYYGGYVVAESVAPCNKPLIKAAPDMYKALKEIFDLLEEHQPEWYLRKHYNAITNALAKAEGSGEK